MSGWPGWSDIFPALAGALTLVAVLLGAVWAWARLSDRMVSRAVERAARGSDRAAREAVDALYERLRTNDFQHVEDRIGAVGERIDRVEARIGERLAEARQDRKAMEGRLLAAIRAHGPAPTDDPEPVK